MQSPDLLLFPLPTLLLQFKRQTDEFLSRIVRANYNTQFAQAASELTHFRQVSTATDLGVSGMDDDSLADLFRNTVHFTNYDAYAPFTTKLLEKPCKASSIVDLLAPGVPDYLTSTSSTSGDAPKFFPKYNCSSTVPTSSSDVGSWNNSNISDTNGRRTTLRILNLWIDPMDVEDEENCPIKKIYLCPVSVVMWRKNLNLDPERDKERMGTFVLDNAVPHAAAFIKKWRSFLLTHALFAVAHRSLETMTMLFINTFVDMMHHLDLEFDVVVDSIENGTIPSLDGIEEEDVRRYLEPSFLPDPERAAELRRIGRPSTRPGWCAYVWPKLHLVTAATGGSFASSVPLARWYLGTTTDIRPRHYASTEASKIGTSYHPQDPDVYKLTGTNVIEFLDVEKQSDSISSLSQPWEVEVGKQYEIVVTNLDGLWRYRLGDVIEITGFDPTDGIPIIKFIERRNVILVIEPLTFTEKVLRAAISSTPPPFLMNVVDWTTTIDERWLPKTIGFFVELAIDELSELTLTQAPDQVWDTLIQQLDDSLPVSTTTHLQTETFRKPTIRLVRSGTFSDFRQLKLDEGNRNVGQIKVPVILPKVEYVSWFSNRVVREL